MTAYEKSEIIMNILEDKKAQDIKLINLDGVSIIADYLVIATGMNKKHIEQLGFYCEEELEKSDIAKNGKSSENIKKYYGNLTLIHGTKDENLPFYNKSWIPMPLVSALVRCVVLISNGAS